MGILVAAHCDNEECEAPGSAWYGDDVELSDEAALAAPVFREVAEYLPEYEEWAVVDGKLLCPTCKPQETEETP